MAVDVTIKNIPPKLYKKPEARAAAHRNGINCAVIRCLDEVSNPQRGVLRAYLWLRQIEKSRWLFPTQRFHLKIF